MKKLLLLSIAALTISSAHAQFNMSTIDPASRIAPPRVMKLDAPVSTEKKAPKKAKTNYAYYNRPAGAFVGNTFIQNGSLDYSAPTPIMVVKPNSEYTFSGVRKNMEDSWWLGWDYFDQNTQQGSFLDHSDNLTINTGYSESDMPYLGIFNQDDEFLSYYQLGSTYNNQFYGGLMLPIYDFAQTYEQDLLLSSKTMVPGGRFGDVTYYIGTMAGATPYGNNDTGWWFGKNGGYQGKHVDGIAQAFEKPEHPYILKQVVLEASYVQVTEDVEMTCKVYKLANGIPAYKDDGCVELPSTPGELIATGRATIAPGSSYYDSRVIVFSLFGNNGKEITPTIKDAIFIAIDGYNDPEMENLVDFTAFYSNDTEADEGFGELAYVKNDLDGEYVWSGLNNFFGSGTMTMKTGLSIYITTRFSYEDLEQTEAPVITYETTDDAVIITATGEGTVTMYVNNEPVENPYTIMRGEEATSVTVTAYAQEDGKEISEAATLEVPIPALELVWQDVEAPVIAQTVGDEAVTVVVTWPTTTGDHVYTGEYTYTRTYEDQTFTVEAYTTESYPYRESEHAIATIVVPAMDKPVATTPEIIFDEVKDGDVVIAVDVTVNNATDYTIYVNGVALRTTRIEANYVENKVIRVVATNDPGYPYVATNAEGIYTLNKLEKADVAAPVITYEVGETTVTVTVTWPETDGEHMYNGLYTYDRGANDYDVTVEAYTAEGETCKESEHATQTITIPALPAVEKTASPSITANAMPGEENLFNGHGYYQVIVTAPEGVVLEYRVKYENGEWSDWMIYDEPVNFGVEGSYVVEARAKEGDKEYSDPVSVSFTVTKSTGLDELAGEKAIAGVRYFNLMGQEMQQANGMTIVVTTYTDGTTTATKVMK